MIDVIATRRTNLNGKTFEKDEKCQMPLQQFQDLEPTGLFVRVPKPKSEPKSPANKPD